MSQKVDEFMARALSRRNFVKGGAGVVLTAVTAESFLLLSACTNGNGTQTTATTAAETVLDKALAGIGGKAAVLGLSRFSYQATGVRGLILEALRPESDPVERTDFVTTVSHDLAGNKMRLDIHRDVDFLGAQPTHDFSEVIAGNLGVIIGVQGLRGGPELTDMLSERSAAIRAEQRLLNPIILLKEAAANPSIAADGGTETFDGAAHDKLVIQTDVSPVTLFIRQGDGTISKLSTQENDMLRRDTKLEVLFSDWRKSPEISFPMKASLILGGQTLLTETRTSTQVNPAFEAAKFAFPAGAAPAFNAQFAERGRKSSQYFQMFAAVGLPREGSQTVITATELEPGVFHLTGGSHHSMVVEQSSGIVVAEAPLDDVRSAALIAWIKGRFPGKPITHAAVATHHHVDHSGGLRHFAAEGATIVGHVSAKTFWDQVFTARSTILPDALEKNRKAVKIESVPAGGKFTIADSLRPVTIYEVASTHAADIVAIVADNEGCVFVSDIYSPGPGGTANAGTAELAAAIDKHNIHVHIIAGGHGGTATIEEFRALPAAPVAQRTSFSQPIVCPCQLHCQ